MQQEKERKMLSKAVRVAGLAVAAASLLATGAAAQELKFMTGPQGGFWVPLGGALKDMWEKNIKGLSVQALPGAGIANVRGIEEDKADLGFGNSISTVDAMIGKPPFNKPHDKVCNIATLYPQYFHFVVLASANINKVSDLKGKSITTQQRGNTGELITRQFLEINGVKYSDVKVSMVGYTDSVTQMQDGHAVAFGLTTQVPAGAVMDLASARDIKLIDQSDSIDKMRALNAGYDLITIPKGSYPKQDQDVKVIGFHTHVVAACKLPEQVVYAMTKSIADNTKTLATVAKDIGALTPKGMAVDIGVPFHAGAAKFYKEAGLTVKTR
jgi:TRAP transporter TAXI family solute receptor